MGTVVAQSDRGLLHRLAAGGGNGERITYAVIERIRVPVLRRVLEAILVFDHGFHPLDVTASLSALRRQQKIERFPIRFEHKNDLYYSGNYSDKELERFVGYLRKLYTQREASLNGERLGKVAQEFVRNVLIAHREYTAITTLENLGKLTLPNGKHSLDLKATHKAKRYGVSIKNESRWVTADSKAIRDAVTKAKEHGVLPWLIACFVTEEAVRRCKRDGIRIDAMGAQIVPSKYDPSVNDSLTGKRSMRPEIQSLRAVVGPQPYRFIPKRIRDYGPYFFGRLVPKG